MKIRIKEFLTAVAGGCLWAVSYCAAFARAMSTGTVSEDNSGFFVGKVEGLLLFGSIVLLIILFSITFVHMRKFNKSEKVFLESKTKMQEDYELLEAEYNELMGENSRLESQYQECRKARDKAERLAYTDYLTALPNEASFNRILDSVIVTLRSGEIVALLIVELSNYKEIVEQAGYRCGDELMIDAAHRLMQALDENDTLAKGSGSRFLVLTQNIENTSVFEDKLKKIQKVFCYPVVLSASECFVNIGIGITLIPKDGKSAQTLLKNAETALFEACRRGRNQYLYFNDTLIRAQMEKIQLQADMRSAAANAEYTMYYQPIIELKSKRIIGAEALIRWEHPQRGLLLPAEFLPLAEANGQIVEIGRYGLACVCGDWKEYVKEHPEFRLWINFSNRQLSDENFIKMIETVLEQHEFPAGCLQLDITEMIRAESYEKELDHMFELKEKGITLCLDDFGTGYSSLGQLLKFPIDAVKIDNELFESLFENNGSTECVADLVRLLHDLKLQVIAEKVEFTEQEELLEATGFDCAQGYLYGHPLPFEQIRQFL